MFPSGYAARNARTRARISDKHVEMMESEVYKNVEIDTERTEVNSTFFYCVSRSAPLLALREAQ